ncbi:MAG: NAD-dependent epimerase/dehydratase family protein [Polyangiaceae bacterium]|nr:NAD-dependent epimerase/dehydratase family protein [Polyangiaceae bacterium]
MRILVTGGAGFIGSHVAEQAKEAGHEVAVLDNLSTGKRANVPAGVELLEVDLRDREATRNAVLKFKPQAVSHQAAQASVSVSVREPKLDADVNISGGLNLLDACAEAGVERVVFASTGGAIYGEVPEGSRATEQTQPSPISPYAISKLTLEHYLGFYEAYRKIQRVILRYANVYGPRQDAHGEAGVIAIFLERALHGEALQVNAMREEGDAGCVRDYTYVTDVARANVLGLLGKLEANVMNIGTGVPTTTLELARVAFQAAGRTCKVVHASKRAGDIERSLLDPTLCQRALGELVGLGVGLTATAEWYRSQAG